MRRATADFPNGYRIQYDCGNHNLRRIWQPMEDEVTMNTRRRMMLALLMLAFVCLSAPAQDAGQVLRLSVSYNTAKNSATLTDERRAEAARLERLAQEANAARRYGDAIKYLTQAMAVVRDQPWTWARALTAALTVKPDRALVEPAETVRLHLGQIFALDEKPQTPLVATVELLPLQGNEALRALKTVEAVTPDFLAQPKIIDVQIPDVEAGNYRLSVTLKPTGATESVNKSVTLHIERGLAAKFKAAEERATKLEAQLKAKLRAAQAKTAEALLAALPSARYRLRLFHMASASEINFARLNFAEELGEAVALLTELEAGRDPFAARRGDMRKAYLSKVDDTLQPYRVFVPASYDGSKAYPLIIALHGMGGDENSYFDSYAQGAFKVEAEKRGYIVACPKGREPASMYVGAAERDVMDVLEEVRRAYRIDADRVYMTGHSMGGYGTWSVAMNYPQVFAALAPVAGGGNPAGMTKIAHVAQLVVHGDNDKTVAVERSRVMVEAAKKLSVELKYIEIPGGDHISVAPRTFKDVYDFFDTHKRKGADAKAAGAGKGN